MCGIVGYIGPRQAQDVIMGGLKRLEYRGYDSAGLAILAENGQFTLRRDEGKLSKLLHLVDEKPVVGHTGIGHTRWATHGRPSKRNAHPHISMKGRVVLVHNGIVENYLSLKDELASEGVIFQSDTDSEVIVQMIEKNLETGHSFPDAVSETLKQLNGSNAIVVLNREHPDQLVCARLGNAGGIALGISPGEMFVASDIPAILEYTRDIVFLENRQMAFVQGESFAVSDLDSNRVEMDIHTIPWDPVSALKGEYKHFMQKEIFEQPRALVDTIRGRIDFDSGSFKLDSLNLDEELAIKMKRLFIIACGTSYYAGLVGKFLFENIARVPVEVDYGSEFRYRSPLIDDETVVLSISQSGETADTLAATDLARSSGALLWSIVNVFGSQSMRTADGYVAMQAGPEIGVATTKAFTTSLVDLYLIACLWGIKRGLLSKSDIKQHIKNLSLLPDLAGRALNGNSNIKALANHFHKSQNFLFIGRGINYPIALEGALKLKEISYIHAEGYPAGEMKHGPIALIDETMPIVAIATRDDLYEKMISQIEQAKSRGGTVIAIATEGDEIINNKVDHTIYVPETPPLLAPVVNVIPLQLLSYHIAVRRGCDVDQPRNLAKSVTVE
ncbi:MAG: glutamine--fructose-6-phosphate transaminase (isomerizing) [Anaerolineae bacterium]|nr:MAG: glutamine--fructose-6-phosphate transaminase (isomerizing) [Anaerolineae bacterium]